MSAVCLWLISESIAPHMALAQSVDRNQGGSPVPPDVTIYLPEGHPVYSTIERLRSAGLITNIWLNQRPLSRLVIARALLVGSRRAHERGMLALAEDAEWRLREFASDLEPYGETIEPAGSLLKLHWEGNHHTSITAEPTLSFIYDGRTDIPPDYRSAAIARWGFELYGTAGRRIGYAARYRESYEDRGGTVADWRYSPHQTIAHALGSFGEGRAYSAYSESNSHISWDGDVFGLDLRLDSPSWGPSPGTNLILSGHTPSFGHLQMRLGFGEWFRYTMLAGSLNSDIVDSLRSYQPADGTDYRALKKQKHLIGHRIDIRLRPDLVIGFTEAVVTGERFPELSYLVPTASLWDTQHLLDSVDNVMMALDISWSPAGGPHLYGSFAIDEWSLTETFSDASQNWLAFQLGGAWVLPVHQGRWHIWVEATRILPNVYRHKYPVNDWTHTSSGLGFWSGQNSEVIEGHLTFFVSPRISLTSWGRYARKGGEVSRLLQYQNPPVERFMDGADRYGAWTGIRMSYEGPQHWRIVTGIARAPKRLWPHDAPPASLGQEWQFAVRWMYNPF